MIMNKLKMNLALIALAFPLLSIMRQNATNRDGHMAS